MAEPVRDHAGHTVWRVRVAPGERTCLGCGDTFHAGDFCLRCNTDEDGKPLRDHRLRPPSVPTLSYLRSGEREKG